MVNASYFDNLIQAANGMAIAPLFGSPFAVRRLGPYSNGSILAQPPILSAQFQLDRSTKRDLVETQLFDLVWMIATGDARQMLLGDILTGIGADTSTYCYAQHRLTDPLIFVRADKVATLSRPQATPSPPTPTATRIPSLGTSGIERKTEFPITLFAGKYSVGAVGAAAAGVPCSFQPLNRIGDSHSPAIPTALPVEKYIGYVTPTPGFAPQPNDRLDFGAPDGRFEVLEAVTSPSVAGATCLIQRIWDGA